MLAQEKILWYQKSREEWLEYGDRNTRYFHGVATNTRRRNRITSLQDESGNWIDQPEELEDHAMRYYSNLFFVHDTAPSFHMQNSFPTLEEHTLRHLARDVIDEEIFSIVKSFGAFKAPGLDGFHAIFYHSQWQLIGQSFCELIRNIFDDPRKVLI